MSIYKITSPISKFDIIKTGMPLHQQTALKQQKGGDCHE